MLSELDWLIDLESQALRWSKSSAKANPTLGFLQRVEGHFQGYEDLQLRLVQI